jgi:hypothetical protein
VGGGQLLVGVVGAVLAAVVRVSARKNDGAYPVKELHVEAVIGEPEELIVGGVPDGAVDHHGFRL